MLTNILENKTILILGADGQLGTETTKIFNKINNVNILTPDYKELDITDNKILVTFFEKNRVDAVINCAAYTAVDKAESDSQMATLLNTIAPSEIAKITKSKNILFVHISTDYVFSGEAFIPYKETDKTSPQGVYGTSKLNGENLVLENNPNSIIIRTSWLYSITGSNFVKTMIKLGKERDELGVLFDQVGTPTYAHDLANAIYKVVIQSISAENVNSGIYHFSNEGVCSWFDFAKEIMKIANLKCNVKPIETKDYPTPTKRPPFSVLNKSKIKNTFGITIPYWHDSLVECIKQMKLKE